MHGCVCFCWQVSSEVYPETLGDTQTFTIGVMPQTPGLPQLSPGADLQITVRFKQQGMNRLNNSVLIEFS